MKNFQSSIESTSDLEDNCEVITSHLPSLERRSFATIGKIFIVTLAAFHLLKELFQLTQVCFKFDSDSEFEFEIEFL